MKKQALALVTLALSVFATSAHAADLQSVIQRLDAAEQQLSAAQSQVSYAKQELYQLLQAPQGPRTLCIFNYMNKQYRAEGATEAEAKENVIFACSSDRANVNPGDCRYWHNKNGATQCRTI